MTENSKRSPRFLLLMPEEIREGIEASAKRNNRTLTKEINTRLRISLAATGPTLQTQLAQQEAARTTPSIAPSATTTPLQTGPNGQPVQLSDHDLQMLRIFHGLSVEKQLALLSLFK